MRCRTEDVLHLVSIRQGVKERGAGRMACRSRRVYRRGCTGLSRGPERRPCALSQSVRAPTANGERRGGIDRVPGARVSGDTVLEDRQHSARTRGRVARDLTKFVFAQLNPVRVGWHGPIVQQVAVVDLVIGQGRSLRCLRWVRCLDPFVTFHGETGSPGGSRLRQAIEHARTWVRGEVKMAQARAAGSHAMGAARDLRESARHAAYAAGQALLRGGVGA